MYRVMIAALVSVLVNPFILLADELQVPEGDPILTVSGSIDVTNADGVALFDLAGLEALGTVEIETSTIWTEGVQTFEGVPLKTLLDRLDVTEGSLSAVAINDYAVQIPITDAVDGGPILAFRMNGAEMSIRDKGPIWVIYPFDASADYQTEVIYSRSIWQLARIEVAR